MPKTIPVSKKISRERGFTLIELLVTVVIAGVLAAIGLPSFQQFMKSNRLTTTANSYLAALNLARSEAIKRGNSVTVCASSDQATCTGSTDWSTGWIVFVDNTPTIAVPASTAPTAPTAALAATDIRVWPELDDSLDMVGVNSNGDDISFIRYRPNGLADINYAIDMTLTPDECQNKQKHVISTTITGSSHIEEKTCS